MRRRILLLALSLVALLAWGCGGKYQLPTEHPAAKLVPSDKSYAMIQTWKGMNDIQDILLTQGKGSQLFMLFNGGGTQGPDVPRGYVKLFPFSNPTPVDASYFPDLKTLFNPVALAATTDKVFVLDQGDTCMAKYDSQRGTCEADPTPVTPTTHPRPSIVWDYRSTWRVREFWLNKKEFQGDTVSSFTDTSFVQVFGVAADDQGHVYVSGVAALLDTSKTDVHVRERHFTYRIFRYSRGPKYSGLAPDALNYDVNMPGCNWHRDTTWFVGTGTGTGFVTDPRGICWSPAGSPSLFVADKGNKQAKTISPYGVSTGYVNFDGSDSKLGPFDSPEAVAADLQGYLYVVDRTMQRVERYDPYGQWVQTVNVELNSDGQQLDVPVAVGVDDSVAYIGDRGRSQVIRYKRRP